MKQKVLLLHGALESARQFDELKPHLEVNYEVLSFDFIGHGSQSSVEEFNIGELANQLGDYLNKNELFNVNILGYSMGGYVALYALPQIAPHVKSITSLSTKWAWTDDFIESELKKLNPEIIEEKVPKLTVKLQQEHPNTPWKSIIKATASMMTCIQDFPVNNTVLNTLEIPVYIMRGSDDKMVSAIESQTQSDSLLHGKYIELPDFPHLLHKMDASVIADVFNKTIIE